MRTYEEFIANALEARPRADWWRELRALSVDNGTLQILVLMIWQQRQELIEALAGRQMLREEDIRAAIGTQGQVSGIDIVLRSIYEAMQKPQTEEKQDDEVSGDNRTSVP